MIVAMLLSCATSFAQVGAISGPTHICIGSGGTETDTTAGGTWSSSNPAIAPVIAGTGTVSGVSAGVATITYTVGSLYATQNVTIDALPPGITGPNNICIYATATETIGTTGGTWSSSNPSIASIIATTGVVTGVGVGVVTLTYTLPSTCMTTMALTVNALPAPITGPSIVCGGIAASEVSAPTGGTWTSTNPAVGTINSVTGVFTGIATGTTIISYSLSSGCTASKTMTVNTSPVPITGPSTVCIGSAITLSDASIGGTFSSGSTAIATVGATTGVVVGITAGPDTITYTLPSSGCSVTKPITVNPLPGPISGPSTVCNGSCFTLTEGSTGGTWSSLTGYSIATVGAATGIVCGLTSGVVTIAYVLPTGCYTSKPVTVNSLPTAYSVTGGGAYCSGGTGVYVGLAGSASGTSYQLYLGGTPLGSPLIGTGAAISFGLMTIPGTYTVSAVDGTGCSGTMTGSATVSVSGLPTVYAVTGGGSLCSGGTGVNIGLANSQTGVVYALYNGAMLVASIAGTGSAISFGILMTSGTYTIVATNVTTGCSSTMSGSATVSVSSLPTLYTVFGGGAYCAGGAGMNVGLSGSQTGFNYQLYNGLIPYGAPILGTGAALTFGMYTAPGAYKVIADNPATGCIDTMLDSAIISISPLPTPFTVSGGGTYCAGGTGGHITLSGSTPGVTYQLYNGGTAVGAPIAGTGAMLDFGFYTTGGTYTITGTVGTTTCTTTMTGTATITINPMPLAYSVTGGGSYCPGGAGVNVGLSGSQSGVNYTLMFGGGAVVTVSGTGSAISFGLQTAPGTYTVEAVNTTTGCTNFMTGSVIVSISSSPTAYTVTGSGAYCYGGTGLSVGLSGSSTGTSYQLYYAGTALGSPMAGTGAALNFGLMTSAGIYTVSAIGGTGCSGTMTGSASISINPIPTAFSVVGGGTYCAGGAGVNIDLIGTQTGIDYQLYRSSTVVGSSLSGTGSTISFGAQTIAGTYTAIGTDPATGCTNTMSGSATVTVSPLPAVYTVAGGGSYCSGGTGVHVGLVASEVGVSYQLYLDGVITGTPLPGTGSGLDFELFTGVGTYTIVATDDTTTCTSSMAGSAVIAVNPLPTAYTITGGGTYCSGGSGMAIGLSGSQVGVSYQLYVGGVAVGTTVTGTGTSISFGLHTAAGIYTVVATNLATLCTNVMPGSVTITVASLPNVYTVTGGGSYCSGGTGVAIGLSNSNGGISYQLYIGGVLTGLPVTGTGGSISFGPQTSAGTYTVVATNTITSCSASMSGSATVTINPTTGPPVVSITASPGLSVCAGSTVTFTATPTVGGTSPGYQWNVNGTAVTGATNATYAYMPVAGDLVGVTLTSSSPCVVPATATATVSMTVTAMVTPTIAITASPGTTVCAGTTVLYSTTVTGSGSMPAYLWWVNGVPVGTGSTYSYVALAGDVIEVAMTSSATCIISPTATYSVTMTIDVPAITASTASSGCGPSQTLTAGGGTSYSWSPSAGLSCSTCSYATLIPDATTQYTVTGTDGLGCSGTDTVTVDGNRISGYITYSGTSADTFTVWLIQFNPIDSSISATDSTTNCISSGTPYYEFMDKPAGNYLVKAKLNSSVPGTSGYIPTYSLSTSHWYSATSLAHSSSYDSMHINMIYGTVPPGPGFIAGYVVSGAGKNTSSDAPAKGMIIYLNDTLGNVISFTYTDSAGTYSFSNLNEGSYRIYPENYKYYTTPSAIITLAPGNDSVTTVDFKQHTSTGTIVPYDNTKTPKVIVPAKGIAVYPNPATGVLNIRSDKASAGVADIILTDVTGRVVLKNSAELNAATGNTISLNGIDAGIYLITIKSDKVFYCGKLVIEK